MRPPECRGQRLVDDSHNDRIPWRRDRSHCRRRPPTRRKTPEPSPGSPLTCVPRSGRRWSRPRVYNITFPARRTGFFRWQSARKAVPISYLMTFPSSGRGLARRGLLPRQMYEQTREEGRRKYTVAQTCDEFRVTRPTIYRHLLTDQRHMPKTAQYGQYGSSLFGSPKPRRVAPRNVGRCSQCRRWTGSSRYSIRSLGQRAAAVVQSGAPGRGLGHRRSNRMTWLWLRAVLYSTGSSSSRRSSSSQATRWPFAAWSSTNLTPCSSRS